MEPQGAETSAEEIVATPTGAVPKLPPVGAGFEALLEMLPDAMVIVDRSGMIMFVNAHMEKLFGYRRDELVGEPIEIVISDRSHGRVGHSDSYFASLHSPSVDARFDLNGRRKDRTEFPVEMSVSPLEAGDRTLVTSMIRDVTDRRQAEQDAAHFRAVVESSHDAIIGKDLHGVITSWNAGAERLYGYSASEAIGRPIAMLAPPAQDNEMSAILRRVGAGELVDDFDTLRACKDGTYVDVALTVSPIRDRHGVIIGASTIARDISTRLRYQQQLEALADHDALTGVRNRRRFERDINEQVGRAHRYQEHAALLLVDINRFKRINDTYGHSVGDRMLKSVASILASRLRTTDALARIGGDEFAILLPYANAEQSAVLSRDLEKIIAETPVAIGDGDPVSVSVSIGIVRIDGDTDSAEEVLGQADAAMYANKP
jgi:diguanylate cyclase (GGDEF)-like protein/PAS domain S-box-containing protein